MWFHILPPRPQTTKERFSFLIRAVTDAVLGCQNAGIMAFPLFQTISARVVRIGLTISALLEAMRAGNLPVQRATATGGTGRTPANVAAFPCAAAFRLPCGFDWLRRLVPGHLLPAGQLQEMLEDPELRALLAESPQAVRAVRSLCWMLGVRMPKTTAPEPALPTTATVEAVPGDERAMPGNDRAVRNEAIETYSAALRGTWNEDGSEFEKQPKW